MQAKAFASCGRLAAFALILSLCTSAVAREKPSTSSFDIEGGVATYYADSFQGRRTANGEYYNEHAYSAAHRTLPFGTYVRVTNVARKKSVIVRINDRGPYVGNRIIDLSFAAASAIGLRGSGHARVTLERIPAKEARAEMSSYNLADASALKKRKKAG
jgi:rare lipoprotein A